MIRVVLVAVLMLHCSSVLARDRFSPIRPQAPLDYNRYDNRYQYQYRARGWEAPERQQRRYYRDFERNFGPAPYYDPYKYGRFDPGPYRPYVQQYGYYEPPYPYPPPGGYYEEQYYEQRPNKFYMFMQALGMIQQMVRNAR